jgi:endonuclease YncB( thermonuclease family)
MSTPAMAEQIAKVAVESQRQRTGLQPKSVNVVVSGDTLVITLQGASGCRRLASIATTSVAGTSLQVRRWLYWLFPRMQFGLFQLA